MGDEGKVEPAVVPAVKPVKISWLGYIRLLFGGRRVLEEMINQGKLIADTKAHNSFTSLPFWLSVISGVAAIGGQLAGVIPPPYGQIAASVSALLYAVSRGISKRDDPLGGAKPAIATTEAWVNILTAGSQVMLASQGLVPPNVAAILASLNAGAVAVADNLAKSGARVGGQITPGEVENSNDTPRAQ